MKILFYNCVYRPGHLYFDTKLISYLSKVAEELIILQPEGWFDIKEENITYVDCELRQNKKTKHKRASLWRRTIINSVRAAKEMKRFSPDVVVVGEYELSTFGVTIGLLVSKCPNIVIVHHNNIDQLRTSLIKRSLFKTYKNKVFHCTLEPYIKEFIQKEYGISQEKVFCWPHPSEPLKEASKNAEREQKDGIKEYDIIGLSRSNDEGLIDSLIQQEKKESIFKNNGLRILLKSKTKTFDDGALTVIKGWIQDDEYKRYYSSAKSVFVAFPDSYQYRVSATLIEAFRDRIPVIGSDIKLIWYYQSMYPHICQVYSDMTFVNSLKTISEESDEKEREFELFIERHSDQYITNQIQKNLSELIK